MAEENKCRDVEENERKKRNKKKGIFDGVGFWVFGNEEGEVVNWRGEVMETTGKKRKRRRKEKEEEKAEEIIEEEEGFERRDPLDVFGSDVMMMILSCLDARSVALSLLVSRRWHGVASSDRLWTSKVCLFCIFLLILLWFCFYFLFAWYDFYMNLAIGYVV